MKGTNKKTCKNIKGSLKLTTLGFTLVELLAVIVILAIILVIAVPKVISVIEDAKKATLESTAKMIASAAEKQKVQNTVLGNTDSITCDSVAKINKTDYASCSITFEDNTAKVTIEGKGKFKGLNVCGGTKTSAEATNEFCELICEYGIKKIINVVNPYEVKDYDSCLNYLSKELPNYGVSQDNIEEVIPILCRGEEVDGYTFEQNIKDFESYGLFTLEQLIENNVVKGTIEEECLELTPEQCFAFDSENGAITGYDISCGTDVVIPSKINGEKVKKIGFDAFTSCGEKVAKLFLNDKYYPSYLDNDNQEIGLIPVAPCDGLGITSVKLPNTLRIIQGYAFGLNNISEIEIPRSVTSIGSLAFVNNPLTNVYLGNQDASIGSDAFGNPSTITTHNLPNCYINYGACNIDN